MGFSGPVDVIDAGKIHIAYMRVVLAKAYGKFYITVTVNCIEYPFLFALGRKVRNTPPNFCAISLSLRQLTIVL